MYQVSIQSVNSFKSYRANKLKIYTQTDRDRHTDRHIRKNHFFEFRGSQNVDIWQKRGDPILHKSNTFSDENVKNWTLLYYETNFLNIFYYTYLTFFCIWICEIKDRFLINPNYSGICFRTKQNSSKLNRSKFSILFNPVQSVCVNFNFIANESIRFEILVLDRIESD